MFSRLRNEDDPSQLGQPQQQSPPMLSADSFGAPEPAPQQARPMPRLMRPNPFGGGPVRRLRPYGQQQQQMF